MTLSKAPVDSCRMPEIVMMRRMDLVAAEVWAAASKRTDERIAAARKVAQELRELASEMREFMELHPKAASPEKLPGAVLVRTFRNLDRLAKESDRVAATFERFFGDHGVLVDAQARKTIERFNAWAHEQVEALRPARKAFLVKYERDIELGQSEISEIARQWSTADGDGLDAESQPA